MILTKIFLFLQLTLRNACDIVRVLKEWRYDDFNTSRRSEQSRL